GPIEVIGGLVVLIVLAALTNVRVAGALSATWLVWIGRRSYGIYLWHFPCEMLARWFAIEQGIVWNVMTELVLSTLLTLIVADASYRFVEQPLRARLSGGQVMSSIRSKATRAHSAVTGST